MFVPNDASFITDRSFVVQSTPGEQFGTHKVLYKRGVRSEMFTLVLQGWVIVWAGAEEFESELGPWSTLGNLALKTAAYAPDFSAVTQGSCRILSISHFDYLRALEMSRVRIVTVGITGSNCVVPLAATS